MHLFFLLPIFSTSACLVAFVIAVIRVARERNGALALVALAALALGTHEVLSIQATSDEPMSPLFTLPTFVASLALMVCTLVFSRSSSGTSSQREEVLQAMLDSMADAVVAADEQGQFIAFNPAAERIVGIGAMDTTKEHWSTDYGLFLPDSVTPFPTDELPLVRAIRNETFEEVEMFIRNANIPGGHFVSINGAPILDAKGVAKGGLVVFRDTTQRRAAETALRESEERFRDLAENIREVLYIQDATGTTLHYVNRQYEEVWGRTCQSLYDNPRQWLETIVEADRGRVEDAMQAKLNTGSFNAEYRIERPDGSLRWIWDRSIVVRDRSDAVIRIVGIAEDVTERKHMIQELAEKEALARLGEFGAVVAHEVKNPLAGMAGALTVIGNRMDQDNRDAEVIQEILDRIDALDRTVNDILVFARPQTPKRRPVPIMLLLQDGVELLSDDPMFSKIEVRVTGDNAKVLCDPDLLKPVFLNFLVNSAQAMKSEGEINVSATARNGYCEITFTDTGPGVPADLHSKIFEPFFTTKPAGTGLGLPIAKKVIELHGGKISTVGTLRSGLTLQVKLPME